MSGEGILKDASITGSGIEIASYVKEAMRGFENNPSGYHLKFVLGIDPSVFDLVDDKREMSRPALLLVGITIGFFLSMFLWVLP
jgi:hypothetical protein